MTITINNKDGLNQISKFSENKIKHITETNQWGYVMEAILRGTNKENNMETKCYCGHTTTCDCGPDFKDIELPQQERSYSEEDMRKAFIAGFTPKLTTTLNDSFNKWSEQYKKK